VHVTDDGIINKIEGNPTNPSNNGKLCPKGNAGIMRHYDPQRFTQPLRRTNPEKGPGVDPKWESISWEEALDITAREIKKSVDEDPRKILPSIEDFQKMNVWFWPLAFGNHNFYQSGGTMCGGAYHPLNGYVHSAFGAVNDAKYCNYWISNGAGDGFSSHLHAAAASNWVAKARVERGMKVVAVEPRMSIAAAKAEEWIPIRPAADRQFAMSMAHVLVNDGLCDYEFLRKDTNAPYLVGDDQLFVRNDEGQIYVWDSAANCAKLWNDDFNNEDLALEGEYEVNGVKCRPAFQVYKDILEGASPEEMEKITTIPAETVRRISREFAREARIGETIEIEDGRTVPFRPAAYNYYRGAQGHKLGMQTNQAFQLVNMLIGNIDHPGGRCGVTIHDFTVDNNHCAPGECGQMLGTPHQLGHMPPFSWPPNEYHLAGFFPVGVNGPHLNMLSYLEPEKWGSTYKPDVIVNCHSNPVWSIQGPRDKWIEFLRDMRFIVCVDIIPTEMTDFADIILPSHDYLESYNATMIEPPYTEGICFRQPITPPLHNTMSEEDIFNEISERMGILDQYNEVINMIMGYSQFKPELKLEPGRKYTDREIAEKSGLLWNDKPIEWYEEHGHASTERRLDKWYRPWEGMRLLFYIEDLAVEREKLRNQMEEAQVPFRDEWPFEDYQPLPTTRLDPIHEEPEEYNLYAITFKDIQLNFGESLSNPWIKDIVYRDPVHTGLLMNRGTAEKMGFADGDIVLVESPYGKLYGRLKTSEGVHHETIGVSNSLSRTKTENRATLMAGGHYNDMLPYDMRNTDGATGQPETSCKVKLTKLDDWPDFLKQGGSVYQFVDELEHKKGKGGH
jgi:anaerobic selenocysteine-containing dehydrogenase